MNRPKINIERSKTDWALEAIGAIGLLLTFTLILISYNGLPETIPMHFNVHGEPDGFGTKVIIWISPGIALIVYAGMTVGLRFPHAFNYPFEITAENAEKQYRNAILMMRILKTVLVLLFFYLTYATIQTGLGKMAGLGILFLPLFLTLIFGTIGIFIYRGIRFK